MLVENLILKLNTNDRNFFNEKKVLFCTWLNGTKLINKVKTFCNPEITFINFDLFQIFGITNKNRKKIANIAVFTPKIYYNKIKKELQNYNDISAMILNV